MFRPKLAVEIAAPLIQLLEELAEVVAGVTDAHYRMKPVGVIPGSIGGHVRHCLDHVAALLVSRETGQINYDHRNRGTDVESSPAAALAAIDRLITELRQWPTDAVERPLRISVMLSSDGEPLHTATTAGRELAYVLSHTIHHNAIVGALVRTLGGQPPEHFGYAPSTVRHKNDAARNAAKAPAPCAQ